jgi:Flp pilus assembly pilin Flp
MTIHRNRRPLSSRRHTGQGMTEYIIIVALVAIAAIGVFALFGQTVRGEMASITRQLAGYKGSTAITNAQNASSSASKSTGTTYNMGNYNDGSSLAGQ